MLAGLPFLMEDQENNLLLKSLKLFGRFYFLVTAGLRSPSVSFAVKDLSLLLNTICGLSYAFHMPSNNSGSSCSLAFNLSDIHPVTSDSSLESYLPLETHVIRLDSVR